MKKKCFILTIIMLLAFQIPAFAVETKIIEEKREVELSYRVVIEKTVETLNKRDSYYFEIVNPEDSIQYVKDLGIVLPENLDSEITRAEFAVLFNSIIEAITKETNFDTNLIKITEVFNDINNLDDNTINSIEKLLIKGLMGGKTPSTFVPNDILTKNQFNIILERLNKGYTREKLFNYVDSCFTLEERMLKLEEHGYTEDINLTYSDLTLLLSELNETVTLDKKPQSDILRRDVIHILNSLWKTPGALFKYNSTTKSFFYLAKDTSFLSAEEWEYIKLNWNSKLKLSEFLILYDRITNAEEDIANLGFFDSWDKIITYSKNYLGFIIPLIENNEDCFNYFLELKKNDTKHYPYLFARTIHECQHEEFLTLAKVGFSRFKGDSIWETWGIHCPIDPKDFYYYDFTTGSWADNTINTELPFTSKMYEHYPEYVKEDSKVKSYSLGKDSSANELAIYGLLSEFCSFALETKVHAVSYSLGLNKSTFDSLDYDSYKKMELMVKDYLEFLKYSNPNLYNAFAMDSDTIRTINNIIKDMDMLEELYKEQMNVSIDKKLIDWENEIEKGYEHIIIDTVINTEIEPNI